MHATSVPLVQTRKSRYQNSPPLANVSKLYCQRPWFRRTSQPSASRSSPEEMAHLKIKYVEAVTIEDADRCGMWTRATFTHKPGRITGERYVPLPLGHVTHCNLADIFGGLKVATYCTFKLANCLADRTRDDIHRPMAKSIGCGWRVIGDRR